MLKTSIVGGSGYVGGELLRLLLGHPHVEVQQVTSQRQTGRYVHTIHPNLRRQTLLKFTDVDQLQPCELLFLCLPHGGAAGEIGKFAELAPRIIDLSADFRLRDPVLYRHWYGREHPAPEWLDKFAYGLPELCRHEIRSKNYVSGVGCNATAVNLALAPLAREGLLESAVVEVKVGSSEGGNQHSLASHHPERSGVVRSFAPTKHRHQAEVLQQIGSFPLHFSATAVEMVRGVLCTAHCFLNETVDEKEVWKLYRRTYSQEPFVRLVKERTGIYRYPEPKILSGSNYCDVGFAGDPEAKRVVVFSALDNLMKGAAGSAVQSMNIMLSWEENTGLGFFGLHPI